MEISLLTPKCTLVPVRFFDPASAAEALGQVISLTSEDRVRSVEVPQWDAVLVYSDPEDGRYSKIISKQDISGEPEEAKPEMFHILRDLGSCPEYNKILATYAEGYLYLAIAQGQSLLLANVYAAQDFTTAEYYIFLAMKSLQLNPEVSTICWRMPIGAEEEMSLYRYFKSVEVI
ncbi:MAG: DUF3822 family protein [Bacteroidales bacterium]|nr:DUF3822 family protein [Bacteroidales bacterium]